MFFFFSNGICCFRNPNFKNNSYNVNFIRKKWKFCLLQLGRGDYDPLTTRVVHMVENLDVNAEKQALLAEIQGLREKVKSLEDNRLNKGICSC